MGFLKKLLGGKEIAVDPNDFIIPDVIPTTKPGLSFRKAPIGQEVEIDIVGESFKAANVAAVVNAAQGNPFEIYLIAEPTNQYDKNAVAVYTANLPIGYIGKPGNKQWFKWVNDASGRSELLWGKAKAISRPGTNNTGIFGSIYMPKVGHDLDGIIPLKMTDAAIDKSIDRAIVLSNSCDEPETVTQLKSLCKKAVAIATPFAAHAKWVEANPDRQSLDKWQEVISGCEDVFRAASEATYASDEGDVDAVSVVEGFAKIAMALRS
jgi:hypothetical protein